MNLIFSALLLLMPLVSEGQDNLEARKEKEYGIGIVCDDELAYLDNYAMSLQMEPNSIGYVIVYAGREDTGRKQVRARLNRIEKYLTTNRGVGPQRLVKVSGGFREVFTVQLWVVPKGAGKPPTKSTVERREVRYAHRGGESDCSILYQ